MKDDSDEQPDRQEGVVMVRDESCLAVEVAYAPAGGDGQ